jgi:hypothetical protein
VAAIFQLREPKKAKENLTKKHFQRAGIQDPTRARIAPLLLFLRALAQQAFANLAG